jgi:hypothetical protein
MSLPINARHLVARRSNTDSSRPQCPLSAHFRASASSPLATYVLIQQSHLSRKDKIKSRGEGTFVNEANGVTGFSEETGLKRLCLCRRCTNRAGWGEMELRGCIARTDHFCGYGWQGAEKRRGWRLPTSRWLIPPAGNKADQTVVIEGEDHEIVPGRIPPAVTQVIDARGKYLIPGCGICTCTSRGSRGSQMEQRSGVAAVNSDGRHRPVTWAET